jgi:hypothetical protein
VNRELSWYVYPEPKRLSRAFSDSGVHCFSVIPARDTFVSGLLERLERTDDADGASCFLIPAVIDISCYDPQIAELEKPFARFMDCYPFFHERPDRHVVFLLGDNMFVPKVLRDTIVFMPSCARGSPALPLCYFAEPPTTLPRAISDADFDVSFQGTINTGPSVRTRMAVALGACRGKSVCCRITSGYFLLTYDREQQRALRAEYLDLIARSRFVFCPRGDGLNSLRFFETLAWGRLPLLVGDNAALPLESEISYDDFVIRIPENQVENWEEYLDAFLATHPDLEYCSSLARNAFEHWFTVAALRRFVESSLGGRRSVPRFSRRHASSTPGSSA